MKAAGNILYRRLRLIRLNRNLIVFLIFLIVSVGFWFLQTLKETTAVTVEYKFNIINVPEKVIFTSDYPKTLNVTISGRGYSLLDYMTKGGNKVINVNFADVDTRTDKLVIKSEYLRRNIDKMLGNALRFSSVSPTQIEIYYSLGDLKRVPVLFGGKINVAYQHILSDLAITPDSVSVYAPRSIYNNIKAVYTEEIFFDNVDDSISCKLAIQKIHGAKIVPDSVECRVSTDIVMEDKVAVPIYCSNIPENKVLRTFPTKATIKYLVSTKNAKKINADDFVVVVDYNSIKPGDQKCQLTIMSVPETVSHVTLATEQAEFVIETQE